MNDELEHRVRERTTELGEANEMMGLEIGERRRIENELRSARERFRRLVEDLPAVAYLWELVSDGGEGRGYTSPRITDLLGYAPEEWGAPGFWKTRVHPHDRAFVEAMDERSRTTGEPFSAEYRYLAKDGSVVWVVDRATMLERQDGRPGLFQGVLLDITDRKEAERRAEETQTWYMRLSEESPGIVWVVSGRDEDPAVRWQHYYVNAREPDLLGYELDDFAGPSLWRDHLHPDDRVRVIQENEHAWRTGEPWNTDLRMLAKDGSVLWFHLQARTVEFDARGLPEVYQGVMLNIDERKREQESMQARLDRLQSVLDGMPALVWTAVTDPEAGIIPSLLPGAPVPGVPRLGSRGPGRRRVRGDGAVHPPRRPREGGRRLPPGDPRGDGLRPVLPHGDPRRQHPPRPRDRATGVARRRQAADLAGGLARGAAVQRRRSRRALRPGGNDEALVNPWA